MVVLVVGFIGTLSAACLLFLASRCVRASFYWWLTLACSWAGLRCGGWFDVMPLLGLFGG